MNLKESLLFPQLQKLEKKSTLSSLALLHPFSSKFSNPLQIKQIFQMDLTDPRLIELNDPTSKKKLKIAIDGSNSSSLFRASPPLNDSLKYSQKLSIFIAGKKVIGESSNKDRLKFKIPVKENLRSSLGAFSVKNVQNLVSFDKEILTRVSNKNLCIDLSSEEAYSEVTLNAWDT